jgi:hypothetical protein
MRAVRRSPLLRIALLTLAVLFAHTVRSNTQTILPVQPPCPGKVAATQPDSDKKLPLAIKRLVKPGRLQAGHTLFGGPFDFAGPHAATLLSVRRPGQFIFARWTVAIDRQRRPFALRI